MNRLLFFFFLLLTLVGTAMGQQPTLSTAADPAWFYIQVLGDGDRTDRVMTVTSDGDVYGRQLLTSNDMAVAATQLWRAERSGTGYLFYNCATGRRLALRYDRDRTIAIATTLADATRCVFTLSHAAQGHGDYLNILASTTPPGADADEVYLHQANSGGSRDYVIMQVGTAYAGSENSAFRFVPFEDFDIKVSDEASTHWHGLSPPRPRHRRRSLARQCQPWHHHRRGPSALRCSHRRWAARQHGAPPPSRSLSRQCWRSGGESPRGVRRTG